MKPSLISSRRALLGSLAVTILTLGTIGLIAHLQSPTRGLPYFDSFATGKAEGWQAFGGTWALVSGVMRNDSDERGAKLLTGSAYWEDYSIEGDVMLLGLDGDAGFIVRSSNEEEGVDAYDGYYVGLRSRDNSIVLGRAGYGWAERSFPMSASQDSMQVLHWYHLKVLVNGCRLIASASITTAAAPTLASFIDDDCIRRGRIGLRSYRSGGAWRSIVVRLATQHDVDQMLARGNIRDAPSTPFPSTDFSDLSNPSLPSSVDLPQPSTPDPGTIPITNLRLYALTKPAKATVRGLVTLTAPAIYVQDSTGGVAVQQAMPKRLKVGDEVEASGDVRHDAFSSILEHAMVRVLWEGTPIPAVSVTPFQASTGAFDATFIEVEGHLRRKAYGLGDSLILDFDAGSQSFRAILNPGRSSYLYRELKLDSLLRVRGIAVADSAYTGNLTPFAVLVRSSDDIDVLAGPPWWSAGHLVIMSIGLLILALSANLLYQRIENWRLHAVVEERERLAYEMHDTLAQSVAGIGFQLEAIRVALPKQLTSVHQQLDLASQFVRHSHAEARRSVDMLRPHQLESEDLLNALSNCADRLVAGSSVKVIASSTGDAHPLTLRIADTLFRIGQEALANAVRHAEPKSLAITLEYEKNLVRLLIDDNGRGFVEQQNQHSLGVLGMRKRAMSISANLEVRSSPGEGTVVIVTAPLPPRATFGSWPAFSWKLLKESARNVKPVGKSYPYTDSR